MGRQVHLAESAFLTAWLVVGPLLASVAMFVAVIQRLGLLQINRMLSSTAGQGRRVIADMYPPLTTAAVIGEIEEFVSRPVTQIVIHEGQPRAIQAVDASGVAALSHASGAIVEMASALGDTAMEGMVLLRVFGEEQVISERALRNAFS